MFCPKCGIENPDNGKFCRRCGTDLAVIATALSGRLPTVTYNPKGKPISLSGAIVKCFTGLAFIFVAIALSTTQMGQYWWFWMLIPAFSTLGAGVAEYVQLRQANAAAVAAPTLDCTEPNKLPPQSLQFAAPNSNYNTGELVPPSVTERTTRHLSQDEELRTIRFPEPPTN
ncbi:MAG: hypothetical protein C4324_03480 [Blastocatellia bacterium]